MCAWSLRGGTWQHERISMYIKIYHPYIFSLTYSQRMNVKGFLVLLNQEADQTLSHSPLKLNS